MRNLIIVLCLIVLSGCAILPGTSEEDQTRDNLAAWNCQYDAFNNHICK